MKKLCILRHAQTESALQDDDFNRPLTAQGRDDAVTIFQKLQGLGITPDHIYCSPAKRTLQTLQPFEIVIKASRIIKPQSLYLGSAGTILSSIQTASIDVETLLVVAHNPGVHQLVQTLAGSGKLGLQDMVFYNYHPGCLSVLEFADLNDWNLIQPQSCYLSHVLMPPSLAK